jgi:tetratricopeptide (TPR) repeat protein
MSRAPVAVFLLTSLLGWLGGTAHRKTEEGNRRFEQGELDEALAAYTEAQVHAPDSPRLHYDLGNVLYRQGDFEGAAEAYRRALLEGPPDLVPQAAYNLGNTRFQQREYQDAVDAYRRTLEAVPGDLDAKRNLELALRELRQQQQQQQQGRQQQQGSQDDERQQGSSESQPDDEQRQSPPRSTPDDQPGTGGDSASGRGEERPGPMTPEQAQRLLDSLAEDERRNLEQEAARRAVRSRSREKDW